MKIDTNDLISVTEANAKGISRLITDASEGHDIVVIRNNKPAAAIIGMEKLERLQRIEEWEEDIKLLALAVIRSTADTGERVSLADAAARFGIDLDALDDEDVNG
ncbi:type II toxin-antitoxin system Phd/YefM family antitoxin [Nocardia anaemiae]|uniref:type II toxin-antitoxin system Phd/YefM family antitoxin n=1 Tax=Nocardia anaemiae TaxID=263910 RepID=UPI0007A51DED|nr:type II toxin-antitoxin system Phd/YefM family antitoxin [Nocardia anaemiae]